LISFGKVSQSGREGGLPVSRQPFLYLFGSTAQSFKLEQGIDLCIGKGFIKDPEFIQLAGIVQHPTIRCAPGRTQVLLVSANY
jgi:hypothetical protein